MFLIVGYIIAFPLIVFFWKLPTLFVAHRSWNLFLAIVQAAFTFFSDFRYNVITKGLALFATLGVFKSSNKGILLACGCYFAFLVVRSLARLVRKTFSPPRFLTMQREQLDRAVSSDKLQSLVTVPAELGNSDIAVYNETQFHQVVMKITTGIVLTRFLYVWAYHLDRYRRTLAPSLVFNTIAYVWLFLGVGFGFAMINLAAYGIHPESFVVDDGRPTVIAMLVYSFASFALQDGGGISAAGDLAYAIKLCAFFVGGVLLIALVLNVRLAFRREQDDGRWKRLSMILRRRRATRTGDSPMSSASTCRRHGGESSGSRPGMAWLVTFITASIPDEFFDDEESDPPERQAAR